MYKCISILKHSLTMDCKEFFLYLHACLTHLNLILSICQVRPSLWNHYLRV